MIYMPKSPVAPPSLAIEKGRHSRKYNGEDVLRQLQRDFKNKCYLCETKEPHSINVEHFRPHRNDVNLMFDWDNLFFACFHCNNTKGDKFDDILNCTTDPCCDKKIRYSMDTLPLKTAKIESVSSSSPTIDNTVSLLMEIYNGTTPTKKMESQNLRKALTRSLREFTQLLINYYESDTIDGEKKRSLREKIIDELKNSSPFTAFKRWIIRDDTVYIHDFPETE